MAREGSRVSTPFGEGKILERIPLITEYDENGIEINLYIVRLLGDKVIDFRSILFLHRKDFTVL